MNEQSHPLDMHQSQVVGDTPQFFERENEFRNDSSEIVTFSVREIQKDDLELQNEMDWCARHRLHYLP